MHHTREVVALVEIFEDRGEDLGLLVGQGDAAVRLVEEGVGRRRRRGAIVEEGMEVRRGAEDVFVGCEDALFSADDDCDDL